MSKGLRWSDLSRAQRGTVITVALADLGLRAWALTDLARRRPEEVRGPKGAWAAALGVVNSAGLLPAAYLEWARKDG